MTDRILTGIGSERDDSEMDENREARIKYVLGMLLLIAVLVFIAGNFWTTVARQAQLDRQQELEEKKRAEANAVTAIAVEQGDYLKKQVFVELDTGRIFEAAVPKEGIYNRNDVLIAGEVVEYGDLVRIYGDWSAEDDTHAKFTDVTKVVRTGRARLTQVEEYQQIADEAE